MHLRLSTYNIHRCIGRDGIKDPARISTVLSELQADIIALQEVDSSMPQSSIEPQDILTYLARKTGMKPIEGYTLIVGKTRYGNALLTKLPVSAIKRFDISFKKREPRGVIEVEFERQNKQLVLWATHLGLGVRERYGQVQELMKIIHTNGGANRILLGDFNEWLPWGRPLRILNRHFTSQPSPATFPAPLPLFALDRIWIHPPESLQSLQPHSTKLSRQASDHLPLVADLML